MKETLAALAAGVAIAAIVSCGGAKSAKSTMAPVAASDGGVPGMASDPKAQIQALDTQIDQAFAKLDAGARPAIAPPPTMTPTPTAELPLKWSEDPKCKPSEAQVCKDTCALSDSICDSAAKICKIASGLAGDAWAAEKCSSGEASCKAAHDKCCGCS